MRTFRLVPAEPHLHFVRYQNWAYAFSAALVILTLILLPILYERFGLDGAARD